MITPLIVEDDNLSIAWAKGFLALMSPGSSVRHPAIITINNLDQNRDVENRQIRSRLDIELKRLGGKSCSTVAGTIFPRSMWNPSASNDANLLFERFGRAWRGIAKCPANKNGHYFRRLTHYYPKEWKDASLARPDLSTAQVPSTDKREIQAVNQLEFVSETYRRGNHRKSALQASIFDPTRDHTNQPRKGFPCLQQIAFTPIEKGRLSVTGFYATQYQFEKAYGNYLGLYWLGQFMAKQMGLRLAQVVCMASVLNLGEKNKFELEDIERDLRTLISSINQSAA